MTTPIEYDFPEPQEFDEDVPIIGDDMLDDRVEFEAGMSGVTWVGIALIVACIVAFVIEAIGGGLTDMDKLLKIGAMQGEAVEKGEAWRLISATFLHGSFDHIFGNMIMLYILGLGCEHAFGRRQFLTLYVAAGISGSLLSMTDGRVSVGASGAIFGLAGGLIATLWRYRRRLHVRDRRIGLIIVVWAGYQLLIGAVNPEVDNRAHLGGLIGGILVGLLLRPAVLEGRPEVGARTETLAGFSLACLCLIGTAIFFVPRLIQV